jgi:hypothetical protein
MLGQPIADQEMVRKINSDIQTPELRSLLLKIVSDQRISKNARKRLSAYFNGQRPANTSSRILGWIHKAFDQMKEI